MRVTNQVQASCTEGSFTKSDAAKPWLLGKTSMEVYQQVSIICTGYCSGTRDASFHTGAACCHWSILFQHNQRSFDTQGTSRIMANKPSPLWEEQLVARNHVFSSIRGDRQHINTVCLKWFLRNAFLKNRLGNVGLCIRKHTLASRRNDTVLLLHRQLQMEKNNCKKTKGDFFFFSWRNKAATTNDFVSKDNFQGTWN